MKLLLDTCVWGPASQRLRSEGHDVVWAGEWPEDPGDEEILERAYIEGRILVTLDKDFGEQIPSEYNIESRDRVSHANTNHNYRN